jgi:hypothetical protein
MVVSPPVRRILIMSGAKHRVRFLRAVLTR